MASFRRKKKFFGKTENNACILFVLVVLYRSRRENGKQNIRVWRSLVSRLNGVQEASSSNLDTRTMKSERTCVLSDFIFLLGDSNNPMQLSGGQLLADGWTAAVPYFFQESSFLPRFLASVLGEGKDCVTKTDTVPGSAGRFRNPPRLPSGAEGAPPEDPQCQNPLAAADEETLPVGG